VSFHKRVCGLSDEQCCVPARFAESSRHSRYVRKFHGLVTCDTGARVLYHPLAATPGPPRASKQPPVTLQSLKRTEHREVLARHYGRPRRTTERPSTQACPRALSPRKIGELAQLLMLTSPSRPARCTSRALPCSPALEPIHSWLSSVAISGRSRGRPVAKLPRRPREATKTFAAQVTLGGLRHTRRTSRRPSAPTHGLVASSRTTCGNDFTRALSTTTLSVAHGTSVAQPPRAGACRTSVSTMDTARSVLNASCRLGLTGTVKHSDTVQA